MPDQGRTPEGPFPHFFNPAGEGGGVFTTNAFKRRGPPEHGADPVGQAQAILTNSGNANRQPGRKDTGMPAPCRVSSRTARHSRRSGAGRLNGRHRPPPARQKIETAMGRLIRGLRPDGIAAAEEAIMTTDRFPKIAMRKAGSANGRSRSAVWPRRRHDPAAYGNNAFLRHDRCRR